MKANTELYEDIVEKLEFEPSVDAKNITIAVKEGVVTLAGKVTTLFEKCSAERAVKSIEGVKAVANDMEVDITVPFQHTDAEIARAAAHALEWDVTVPGAGIQVSVEKGQVTLTGQVEWWFERQSAEKAIRRLVGVRSVNNKIIIRPKVAAKDVERQIMREFHRNADIDAKRIEVAVDGNKVTLKGHVRSWAESQEATRGAWSVPGITQVDNQLAVSL